MDGQISTFVGLLAAAMLLGLCCCSGDFSLVAAVESEGRKPAFCFSDIANSESNKRPFNGRKLAFAAAFAQPAVGFANAQAKESPKARYPAAGLSLLSELSPVNSKGLS